jgi:mRNA-degrading endonuclease RelE of RelBE toxin-antitoxin system
MFMPGSWIFLETLNFRRELKNLQKIDQRRVMQKLERLRTLSDPRIAALALVGNRRGQHRIRVGKLRVIVTFDEESRTITLEEVNFRREIY